MSGIIYTEFYCDECHQVYNHLEGHAIRSMRQEAQDCDGWIRKDGKDICPACQQPKSEEVGG